MGGGGYQPRGEVLAGLGTMGCWVRLGGLTERLPMPQTLTKTHLDGFGGIILEMGHLFIPSSHFDGREKRPLPLALRVKGSNWLPLTRYLTDHPFCIASTHSPFPRP